ncbi:MAG: hypothetical protein HXX13_18195 [Bacteroidetes bacterium]|nr:hypothetical protein [Bacteroidota bacterium]
MKARILVITLLIILVYQGIFSYFYYEMERNLCQARSQQVRQNVSIQDIFTFEFNYLSGIPWEKPFKELIVDGNLYDVIRIEKIPSGTRIVCYADKIESRLVNDFRQAEKLSNKLKDRIHLKLKLPLFQNYLSRQIAKCDVQILTKLLTFQGDFLFISPYLEVNSPPPKPFFS